MYEQGTNLRFLTALPVYNECQTVDAVLDEVVRHSQNVLVVDDGSTDGTADRLARRRDVTVLTHPRNRGYGAALITAFDHAVAREFDAVVTIDCDGQHQPHLIGRFVEELEQTGSDIISGSRYLEASGGNSIPPIERRRINHQITQLLNARFGLGLTDAFCGFKAYRTVALRDLRLSEPGYAMPLQLWVQAACLNFSVRELPVPLVYLDPNRTFGAGLDDGDRRLRYYLDVIERSLASLPCGCH